MKASVFVRMLALSALLAPLPLAAAESSHEGHDHSAHSNQSAAKEMGEPKKETAKPGPTTWYCPMHPQIQQDGPGTCPICMMDLVPLEEDGESSEAMPDSLKGLSTVKLSDWKQQLIGLKTARVESKKLHRTVDTVGRFGGGKGNFAVSAMGFTAGEGARRGGSRYVIADVYALDIPYIQVGQEVQVRGFAANAKPAEGRVAKIFPYDETQSRVMRVRVDLKESSAEELFANVRILVESKPKVALPASAVIDTGSRRYVFVEMEKGRFMPHEVSLGFLGEDYWEVLSGVNEGDTVVVGANFFVDADSQLKAVLRGMGGGAHQH